MDDTSNTPERILATARSLIVVGGYNGFSYADIAAAVGIRKASIHHHFPTKADLVEELVRQYRANAEEAIAALEATGLPPMEQLARYVQHWQACIEDGSRPFCICALLAAEMAVLPAGVAREVRTYFTALTDWVARAMAQGAGNGVLRLTDPPAAEAEVFTATVHGAMLSARALGRPALFGSIAASLLARLAAGP